MRPATHHALPVTYPVCSHFTGTPANTMFEVTWWGGRLGVEPITRYCAVLSDVAAQAYSEGSNSEVKPLFCLHCDRLAVGGFFEGAAPFEEHDCDDTELDHSIGRVLLRGCEGCAEGSWGNEGG